ncbi:MAG TPA: ankyrin repeat domain-containing protein [Chloroflexota bacterium]
MDPLPFRSPLSAYQAQAAELLAGWNANDPDAVQAVRQHLPRLLDERIPWLPRAMPEAELRAIPLDLADAQLALARWYTFRDWPSLVEWLAAFARDDSPVLLFESAVEAVVGGESAALERLLRAHPDLVTARSTIVTSNEPPQHRATLLHYVAANGVEDYRQKSPANAVEIASLLLRAGAEPDALASMYGGQATTLNMLVSSAHPARAGVQVALAETLLDFGAAVDGRGSGDWVSPLMTALAFGYRPTAEALVRRGARVDTIAAAAGLGLLPLARQLLPDADAVTRHRAVALAAQHGRTEVLRLLLDAGEDPNRFNPRGNHAHSTPLHQAVWSDQIETVRLLVERGARLDIRDTIWNGTPLGWAEFGGRNAIADYLRTAGSPPH